MFVLARLQIYELATASLRPDRLTSGVTYRFTDMIREIRFWPVRGWVGLVAVAVCWLLNWLLPGVRSAYLFFPLWLCYALVVDAVVRTRAGSWIWSRSCKDFVLLFCFSAPVLWLF